MFYEGTMANKEFFNSEGEKMEFVFYEVDRLFYALDRDTSKPIPVFHTETSGENDGKTTQHGELTPQQLFSLKGRTVWSLREEMGMIGEVDTADRVIFSERQNERTT